MEFVFDLFGAGAHEVEMFAAAGGAGVGDAFGVVAVMAEKALVAAMIGERDGAIDAVDAFAAGAAGDKGREAAAIQKEHHLLFQAELLFDEIDQAAGEGVVAAGLEELDFHIEDLDFGHGALLDALGQGEVLILALLDVVAGFEAGGRGAEDDDGVFVLSANESDIAAMVAGRFFLLVAAVVFFVDDDEAEIAHGSEDAGAGADGDERIARAEAAPLSGTFGLVEGGMEDRDAIAEAIGELRGHLRGQGDLGDQEDRAAAEREGGVDGAEVDLGLARAGDAFEQIGRVLARDERGADLVEGGLLMRVELRRRGVPRGSGGQETFEFEADEFLAREGASSGRGVLERGLEFGEVVRTGMELEVGEEFAFGLGELVGSAGEEFDGERAGGGARRVAIGVRLFDGDESFFLEVAEAAGSVGELAGEVSGGEGALLEEAEDLGGGVLGGVIEEELAGEVASGVGEFVGLGGADFAGEGSHAAQDFAERGAIVVGDEAGDFEETIVEDGFFIDEAEGLLGGVSFGRLVVDREDVADELASGEGNEDAAAALGAVL